jgi:hypothetical protein
LLYVDPSGTDYMLFGPDGKILYIWDSAFEGNNTDFEIVSGDGTNLTVVYQGETYSGFFVEGSKPKNRKAPEFDFSVFDLQEHLGRVSEYNSRPFFSHLHDGDQRPDPRDSTKFFRRTNPPQSANPFSRSLISRNLLEKLQRLVGKADAKKFINAIDKGIVGPVAESGIKRLSEAVGKYTYELKIGGSAQRLLGYINEQGELIFDKLVKGGLH